eukprot:SAG11_NODE_16726_length_539_cov_1.063636_1_plen_32_part_01
MASRRRRAASLQLARLTSVGHMGLMSVGEVGG